MLPNVWVMLRGGVNSTILINLIKPLSSDTSFSRYLYDKLIAHTRGFNSSRNFGTLKCQAVVLDRVSILSSANCTIFVFLFWSWGCGVLRTPCKLDDTKVVQIIFKLRFNFAFFLRTLLPSPIHCTVIVVIEVSGMWWGMCGADHVDWSALLPSRVRSLFSRWPRRRYHLASL